MGHAHYCTFYVYICYNFREDPFGNELLPEDVPELFTGLTEDDEDNIVEDEGFVFLPFGDNNLFQYNVILITFYIASCPTLIALRRFAFKS